MIKKKIRGISIWLDPKDHGISKRLILKNGMREPCFDWIIKKEASGVAFDIGANIGWVSLQLAQKCDKVYAFEPDPRNLKLLRKNANEKIDVLPWAVSDKNGEVKMSFQKKPNLNFVSYNGEPVKSVTLDSFEVKPDFLKMDIEGGEIAVFRGAEALFSRPVKILIEVHPDKYDDPEFANMLTMMVDDGFKFKYVVNAKGKIDKFKNYKCVKKYKDFPRAVFADVPAEKVIPWATEMPSDGKKVIRSFLMEKQ